eukprot:2617674-Alexandrium_andersonii.AAC.1
MVEDGFEVGRVGAEQEDATTQLKRRSLNAQIEFLCTSRESLRGELRAAMAQHALLVRAAD